MKNILILLMTSTLLHANIGLKRKTIFKKYKKVTPVITQFHPFTIATFKTEKTRQTSYFFHKDTCHAIRYKNLAGIKKSHIEETKKFYSENGKEWFQEPRNKIGSKLLIKNETLYRGKSKNEIDLILEKEDVFTILIADRLYWKYKQEYNKQQNKIRKQKQSMKRDLK